MDNQNVSTLSDRCCVRCGPTTYKLHAHGLCRACVEIYNRWKLTRSGEDRENIELFLSERPHRSKVAKAKPGEVSGVIEQLVPGFAVCGPAMAEVAQIIRKIATSDAPVIIHGESGTGKEGVARALHEFSSRSAKPFITVNCASIDESNAENELFGHVKGSYTGAVSDSPGLFEAANGGTIFFDELGTLSARAQDKLLLVFDRGEIRRIGSSSTKKVDVRVIAATNEHINELCRAGKFRADLMHRLDVLSVMLPPLRERREEIPVLANFLLAQMQELRTFDEKVASLFMEYPWPGNIRELAGVLTYAAVMSKGGVRISFNDLPHKLQVYDHGQSHPMLSVARRGRSVP